MAVNLLSTTKGVNLRGMDIGYLGKPVTETMTNGFFTVDRKWTVTYWNKGAEKLLEVQAKDIVGKNLWEKFAGVIPVNFYEVYHKAFLQDLPLHFEEYWGEMGAWFDVIIYHCDDTLSVSFKSGNQSGHSEHPEQRLKVLNELYRFVTEVMNDSLWEWDLQTSELFWIDGGHKKAFGYQVENALIPQSFWESCLHPEDKGRVLAKLNKFIGEGSGYLWEDEYRFKKADGSYAYVHDRGHLIYDGGEQASRMIGATQDITARKLAEIQLQAVLTGQENERTFIGKELHDNLNEILGAAKLYIELAKTDEENREMCLEKSSGYIMNVMEQIRMISKSLSSPGIQIMGLFESIRILLDDLATIHPVKIKFYDHGINEQDLSDKVQFDIFKIVQDQLNNIFKYANASRATVYLTRQSDEVILVISDNGEGRDILKEKREGQIVKIKSRAELYYGSVSILSKPGEGYELKVVLPLDKVHPPS